MAHATQLTSTMTVNQPLAPLLSSILLLSEAAGKTWNADCRLVMSTVQFTILKGHSHTVFANTESLWLTLNPVHTQIKVTRFACIGTWNYGDFEFMACQLLAMHIVVLCMIMANSPVGQICCEMVPWTIFIMYTDLHGWNSPSTHTWHSADFFPAQGFTCAACMTDIARNTRRAGRRPAGWTTLARRARS